MEKQVKQRPALPAGPHAGLNREELDRLESRVDAFMAGYAAGAEDAFPYVLKQEHTKRVRHNILTLARSLSLSPDIQNMDAALALVHDLGRFPQFQRYHTYSDPLSQNHAALGTGVICRLKLLDGMPKQIKQIILRAVALHNRASLPEGLLPDLDLHSRLIRDADKMDIFKVMVDLYRSPANGQVSFMTHDRPDDGEVSPELAACLSGLNRIEYCRVHSLNDMKLFQLSMILDLNFPAAHAHVLEQQVVEAIIGSMPQSDILAALEERLTGYCEARTRPVQEKIVI